MENEKLFEFMEKMYSEMTKGFTDVRSDIKDLKEGQLRIEDRLEDTRKTLFDGYRVNSEKIQELSDKIDDLRTDVNNLSIKTAKHDNKIIEMDRKINSR